jgi:hypothetical protein
MNSTPQPPSAAGEHFADAQRIRAALPLVKRGAGPDRRVHVALVHATLAVAAANRSDHRARGRGSGQRHLIARKSDRQPRRGAGHQRRRA